MKLNIHIKSIFIGGLAASALLLSSCLKDTGPVQDFSQSPPVISFQGDGQGDNYGSITVKGTSSASSPSIDSVEISLGVASLYLSTPVKVTVAVGTQAEVDSFNNVYGTSYVLAPSSAYSIQGGGAVTIPAGKNLQNFAVSFYGSSMNATQQYALPLIITGASGGNSVVASNLNAYFALVKIQ